MTRSPRVTIAGGGIAGLTAALRLAERGYQVKLYEQKPFLGGNLASRPSAQAGLDLDVYPHMYLGWYHNFWRLLEDVSSARREELFLPLAAVRQISRGEFPRFTGLTDIYSPTRLPQNLFSGVGPVADMFVFGYACVDLLAEGPNPTMLPEDLTVGGFLGARPYMTERAAAAFDSFITNVWALPSYQASAADYREFIGYCLAERGPSYWLARGPVQRQVIAPLTAAAEAAGVEIVRSVRVAGVSCLAGRVSEIRLQGTRFDDRSGEWVGSGRRFAEEVDELLLAVPPTALSRLVRSGPRGRTIVDAAPHTAELSRLRAQAIPILHLCLRGRLAGIPVEPVGLFGSRHGLAFTDISQTWDEVPELGGRTMLAVSSSDPFGLPGSGDQDDAMAMLRELSDYLDLDPGDAWGGSADVDWERTRYDRNADALLFVNDAMADPWRPAAACVGIPNLYFAGDFSRGRIGMTTIESAVHGGLEAAQAIVSRRGVGEPVEILEPRSLPGALYVWLRYAWASYAGAAATWSRGTDMLQSLRRHLRESWRT